MDMMKFLESKKEDILRIAAEHGAHNVRVFGSVIRGEASNESDVDFLVEFDPGTSLLKHAGLVAALEELLGRKVDVAPEKSLKPRIRERILSEARPL